MALDRESIGGDAFRSGRIVRGLAKFSKQAPKGIDVPAAFGSKADRDAFLSTAKPLGWHARSISDLDVTSVEDAMAVLAKKLPDELIGLE